MSLPQTLEAIAEPTRLRILDAVREEERSVGQLVDLVGMHQPGVSRHLKVLRSAGLVDVRRDGQRRCYRARFEPLQELDASLDEEREYWEEFFDLLKVQDAHARSRCRDLNGTEPWACGDCDCSDRLEAHLNRNRKDPS